MAHEAKRHSLTLPEELFREVKSVAERHQATMMETLRRLIRLGLILARMEDTPEAVFIIRQGDNERQIMLV